jgi:hypothetical protein
LSRKATDGAPVGQVKRYGIGLSILNGNAPGGNKGQSNSGDILVIIFGIF